LLFFVFIFGDVELKIGDVLLLCLVWIDCGILGIH